jgi:organic radical activating enzyme
MKNIAIYGAGKFGRHIKKLVDESNADYRAVAFVDKNPTLHGIELCDAKVISIEELWQKYGKSIDCVWVAVVWKNQLSSRWLIEALMAQGNIREISLVRSNVGKKIPLFLDGKLNSNALIQGPWLSYLLCDIVSHCNLNCRGCTHYSNVAEKEFLSLESFEKDLIALRQKFYHIECFRLMGGEPFLHPRMTDFFGIVRKYFPETRLHVVSNGLLIPKQSPEFWQAFHDYDVDLDISQYPPTTAMLAQIQEALDREKITYMIGSPIQKFSKELTSKADNTPFVDCKVKTCTVFRNGKLAVCPPAFFIDRLKPYTRFYDNSKTLIDIHDENLSGFDILQKIATPSDFCKYCAGTQKTRMDWTNKGAPQLEDWVH